MKIKHNELLSDGFIEILFGQYRFPTTLLTHIQTSFAMFVGEHKRLFNALNLNEQQRIEEMGHDATIRFNALIEANIRFPLLTDSSMYNLFSRTYFPYKTKDLIPYNMSNTAFEEMEGIVLGIINNKYAVMYFESSQDNPIIRTYKLSNILHMNYRLDKNSVFIGDYIMNVKRKREYEKQRLEEDFKRRQSELVKPEVSDLMSFIETSGYINSIYDDMPYLDSLTSLTATRTISPSTATTNATTSVPILHSIHSPIEPETTNTAEDANTAEEPNGITLADIFHF